LVAGCGVETNKKKAKILQNKSIITTLLGVLVSLFATSMF